MERSLIDGVVTEIHSDLTEKEAETKPYLVIQGSGGLQVKGTISEWNLNQLQVGTEIQAMSYDTGDSFTMTVTGVDDIPETDGSAPYDENPSSSVYTFEAETSEQHDIAVGSWLSLSLQRGSRHQYLLFTAAICPQGKRAVLCHESERPEPTRKTVDSNRKNSVRF